jgi:CubicO group peptidase (beta-lactamase class C family)
MAVSQGLIELDSPANDYLRASRLVPAKPSWRPATVRHLLTHTAGGSGDHGSILKPETVALMFQPHYQPDPRIPGMGLAFWRVDLGGHAAVEHHGVVPGFNSQIFLAPDEGVAVMAFTNGSRNAARVVFSRKPSGRVMGVHLDGVSLSADRRG